MTINSVAQKEVYWRALMWQPYLKKGKQGNKRIQGAE